MLTLPPTVRIYVATAPCDMRKQIDGIAALVEHRLGLDARSGHLFITFNRRRDMVRILFWDRSGYCLVTKRLEQKTFKLPWSRSAELDDSLELEAAELAQILEGVDLKRARRTEGETRPEVPTKNRAA